MSSFNVQVRRLASLTPHSNADRLEIGRIDGYQFVVAKGLWQQGELGVYIPEASILPASLRDEMNLTLVGPENNRVKAVQLRGVTSQGLFYKPAIWPAHWIEGLDVADELGITKWEPPVPQELQGQVAPAPSARGFRSYTDIENVRSHPGLFEPGEPVIMTEKIHGTCFMLGIDDFTGDKWVSSKGISQRGQVLLPNESNLYWRAVREFELDTKLKAIMEGSDASVAYLFGEIYGVQDLKYGLKPGQIGFRAFDLRFPFELAEYPADGWVNFYDFFDYTNAAGIEIVPILYEGSFSEEALTYHTEVGSSRIPGAGNTVKEGVVVKPKIEVILPEFGRKILKSINPAYLTRKGNTTEFN